MNGRGDHHLLLLQSKSAGCCCFHPEEVVVGVCSCCLKERLLILAAKQSRHHQLRPLRKEDKLGSFRVVKRKALVALPKVFALGSFLHLLEPHPHRNKLDHRNYSDEEDGDDYDEDDDSIATLEDSFISIKFEDGEQSSWNKKRSSSRREEKACSNSAAINGVKEAATKREVRTLMVEHSSSTSRVLMRWRKHILKLLRFGGGWKKKPKKDSSSNKTEGVKGRRRGGNWIRILINYKERRTS